MAKHQYRQDVLAAYQAAVEQRQAGNGHEQHQCGGRQHPRRVAGVQGVLGQCQAGHEQTGRCRGKAVSLQGFHRFAPSPK
jgi:hypothetical protein